MSSLEDGKGRKIADARRGADAWPNRKPTLASVTIWEVVAEEAGVRVLRAFAPSMEFYRVEKDGKNVKAFYGEMAWADAARLTADLHVPLSF